MRGAKFACTTVTWGHVRRLLERLHEVLGPEYQFAPLHRSEGGIECLRWPGSASTGGRKAVRFDFHGCWPSENCEIRADVTDQWPLYPCQFSRGMRTVTQIYLEGQHSAPWTEEETAKIGACIAAVFSWPVLVSPGYQRIRDVSHELGYTARPAATRSGRKRPASCMA